MSAVLSRLFEISRKSRLAHGLLFVGTDDRGLQEAALGLARQLVCEEALNLRPCGRCAGCTKVGESNHPDVLSIEPEKQELTIDEVRTLHTWILRGPFEARVKVGIVHQADSMNAAAANSLLKILEEPPLHGYLLLLVRSDHSLLPTLRSRVQIIRFPEVRDSLYLEAELPPWMKNLDLLLRSREKSSPQTIFSLTESVAKDRKTLPLFFEKVERHLRDGIFQLQTTGNSSTELSHLDGIFDQIRQAERHLVGRYGNIALTLDPILLRWLT